MPGGDTPGAGPIPAVNTLVEVSILGGDSYRSRVEDAGPGLITVAAPLNLPAQDRPEAGTQVTIRWTAGARGRYAAPARLVELIRGAVPRWVTRPSGPVAVEQSRQYVRGGGGEPVVLLRHNPDDPSPVTGYVVDLGEGGLRARFTGTEITVGERVVVTLILDGDTIDAPGRAYRAAAGPGAQVVIVFDLGERQAQVIRRYVIRDQMRSRNGVRTG